MKRFLLAIATVGLLAIGLTPSLRADQWNKRTVMTVNETIQVPNKVLPPGTYVVKLLDSPSDRHIVQIFNGDETEVLTTILAIPNYRLEPTGDTVFTFWEMPPGQPRALRAWFYPGDNFGQEFAYPKTKAVAIAAVSHAEIPTIEAEKPAELETAPIVELTPETPEAAPVPAPMVVPAEVAKEVPPVAVEELPKTASPYPLIGLMGMFGLVAFAVVRAVRTS
ncbi:MAG TPA: hypothetical protein VLW25_04295 [Bryobacteraceae bacterium]|nr:hypothetical protein [Bryobacteraceae bacterium]